MCATATSKKASRSTSTSAKTGNSTRSTQTALNSHLPNQPTNPMNQPLRYQPRRPNMSPRRSQKEEARPQDYEGNENEPTLDQHAGTVARGLIRQTGIEDTTQNWRALKRAYLAGYEDAR